MEAFKNLMKEAKETLKSIGEQMLIIPKEGEKCDIACKIVRTFIAANIFLLVAVALEEVVYYL